MAASESRDPAPDDLPWDARILERIDAGVDGSLIEENLARTPTERAAGRAKDLLDLAEIKRRSR